MKVLTRDLSYVKRLVTYLGPDIIDNKENDRVCLGPAKFAKLGRKDLPIKETIDSVPIMRSISTPNKPTSIYNPSYT